MNGRSVSHLQDPFQKNKQKKLYASRTWPASFEQRVDMSRVSIESLREWVEKRVCALLGKDDEIVSEYCITQLEAFDPIENSVDPREIQINLEGFLGQPAAEALTSELWDLLLAAQESPDGVPPQLVLEARREQLAREQEKEATRKAMEQKQREMESVVLERERERRNRSRRSPRRSPRRSRSRSPRDRKSSSNRR